MSMTYDEYLIALIYYRMKQLKGDLNLVSNKMNMSVRALKAHMRRLEIEENRRKEVTF